MNIPFLPRFFQKLQIYDELKGFEELSSKKHLWEVQKALLEWTTGEGHQHIGSSLSTAHVNRAIKSAIDNEMMPKESQEKYKNELQQTLTGLSTLGYGERQQNDTVLVNLRGLLAGQIIAETEWLKNTGRYDIWRLIFYFVLALGMISLLFTSISSFLSVIDQPLEFQVTTYIIALVLTLISNFLVIATKRNAWDVVFLNTSVALFLLFSIGVIVGEVDTWTHIIWGIVTIATAEKLVKAFMK